MTDIGHTLAAKVDQLTADDLIDKTKTIKITGAKVLGDEQPVVLNFEGDNGKPYKPCLSMRRVIAHAWGRDSSRYPGQSMTLYRDPAVKFGALEVGGIRISHMTGIDKDMNVALTATRGNKKLFKVRPLKIEGETKREEPKSDAPAEDDARLWATKFRATIGEYTDAEKLKADYAARSGELSEKAREFMDAAINERVSELEIPE